jgi:HEAT repeat protein
MSESALIVRRDGAHAGHMPFELNVPEMPAEGLVRLLADPHRSVHAYGRLLRLGPEAAQAARHGLAGPDARVREYCCKILDHLMDAESIPALLEALADPAVPVRVAAVHALSCDRCKTDACRPTAGAVLAPAIALLAGDPSAQVRAYAAELVGLWVDSHPAARDAIVHAAAQDPSPAVRKKASWYAPGGPIYRRAKAANQRRARRAPVA